VNIREKNNLLQRLICRVADHFYYSCFLGLLASVTEGSWPRAVS